MDDRVQPLFPVPSCAVFGRKQATSRPIPTTVRAYSGDLPFRDAPERIADAKLTVTEGAPALTAAKRSGGSSYRNVFRNGATLFPRLFVFVERKSVGLLGADPTAPLVVSRRSRQEKEPWKSLPSIEHRVEAEFLRPILLGESILPFRVLRAFEGVLPITDAGEMLDAAAAANRGYEGLFGWMREAESAWDKNKRSQTMKLVQLFDYFGQLSAQFPPASIRVIYAKAGTLPAASVVRDKKFIIENLCYWAAVTSEEEASYLTGILNSETARARAEQYQARGQWGARHFDKVIFNLAIPRFNPNDHTHSALAAAAAEAERVALALELPNGVKFRRARALVRQALANEGVSATIDALVAQLLTAD
jgi:hypothetical protein